MSLPEDNQAGPVIVLRRRSGGEDESHHGGVWKIAYADFMTAMMAFFLVMWLINAANTETKASVASYFNPIKLTDNVARKKGLFAVDEKANANDKSSEGKAAKGSPKASDANPKSEAEAMSAASNSRAEPGAQAERSPAGAGASSASALHRPHAFRFDPIDATRSPSPVDAALEPRTESPSDGLPDANPPRHAAASTPARASENAVVATVSADASQSIAPYPNARSDPGRHHLDEAADVIRRESEAAVRRLGLTGGPGLDVVIEGDTIVLSLTDTSTFGMFAVGSAEPNAELVTLLQNIAPVLATKADVIILRGHTDGRPFRTDRRNNNWRLAMARAEAAYGLLVGFGIDDQRFNRIEAHADRKLKIAHDADAAANRRIEIIIRKGAP